MCNKCNSSVAGSYKILVSNIVIKLINPSASLLGFHLASTWLPLGFHLSSFWLHRSLCGSGAGEADCSVTEAQNTPCYPFLLLVTSDLNSFRGSRPLEAIFTFLYKIEPATSYTKEILKTPPYLLPSIVPVFLFCRL